MLAPSPRLSPAVPPRAAFAVCCLFALWAQIVGAFFYTGISDLMINAPEDKIANRNVWKIENAPLLMEARQKRAPFDLLRKALSPP